MVSFGRDLIAEKNKRESIKSSVIKYWNVNYCDPKDEQRMREAQEILDRLDREKEEDEARKRAEIDRAYMEAELNELVRQVDPTYNAATGAYSGVYGRCEVDAVTQDQVQMILNERNATIQGIINTGNAG